MDVCTRLQCKTNHGKNYMGKRCFQCSLILFQSEEVAPSLCRPFSANIMDQGEASSDKAVMWTYWVDKGNSVHMTAFSLPASQYSPGWSWQLGESESTDPRGFRRAAIATSHKLGQTVENPPAMRETWVQSLGWEDPLKKGKATHSNILAWRIPWTL